MTVIEPKWKQCVIVSGINSTILTCGADFTPYIFNLTTRTMFKIISSTVIAIAVIGSALNLLVLLATIRDRSFRKIRLHRFLIALTIVDFLLASIALPIYSNFYWLLHEGKFCCLIAKLSLSTTFSLVVMSVTTISFIDVQLYMAIVHPFKYTTRVNQNLMMPLLILLDVLWYLLSCLSIFIFTDWWPLFRSLSSAFGLLIYLLICCLHYFINREMRRIRNRSHFNPALSAQRSCSRVTRKTMSLATSVLVTFGVVHLPYIFVSVYVLVIGGNTPSVNTYFEPLIEVIGVSKCMCNPVFYCIRLKSVRRRITNMFGFSTVNISDSTTDH